MKPLDWIILIIALPMLLLNIYGYIVASSHPLVMAGVANPNVKPRQILFWFCAILIVVYRVWG